MKLLLDTHVLLWWLAGHPRLSTAGRRLVARAVCHVSAASVWEVAIKYRLGKLSLPPDDLVDAVRRNGMRALPITEAHAAATATLPALHADPFDRLLVVQARLEGIALLSADARVLAYGDGVRSL